MKVKTCTILAATFTAYCIAMAVTMNEAHKYSKTKRCLEEYGEGDVGMCMCYENCK